MKLKFESDLDYQLRAVDAVCDLFHGQERETIEFSVARSASATNEVNNLDPTLQNSAWDLGVGNSLTLLDEQILGNLNAIQARNQLTPSSALESGNFTVEMETGTGKTYVYIRTIYELNRRYGFTKFVIVVPSVAIKEGVYKTLKVTEEHFRTLFGGTRANYFLYDSNKLARVRDFATSTQIQIMVVTVGAINKKDVNNLYKDSEKTEGQRPIDLISAAHPVVIVDEPQSVDGGLNGAGKVALDAMGPLCTLRYSATHADEYHMVFRLDAVDAYERHLVKQIEIASATVEDANNKPFVQLIALSGRGGRPSARVEIDVTVGGRTRRKEVVVSDGDSLQAITNRQIYAGMSVGEINLSQGEQYLELRTPKADLYLAIGESFGGVEPLSVQREMIRRTIREHLDKELRLTSLGIKVLSLFFIDSVDRYRSYDADSNPVKGDYALIFEEEFRRACGLPKYATLFAGVDIDNLADEIHDGYFSIDRRGGWLDTKENTASNRENADRAYNLIMKDKEKLLGFDVPLRFIFSHSALKEGWDNPNVFQICTLRNIQSERDRRQTIGRGLRLCVNNDGERVRDSSINTLTVIASESYEDFAEHLQSEIEADTGLKFGVVRPDQFTGLLAATDSIETASQLSRDLWQHLEENGYLSAAGKVQDSLRIALASRTLVLPPEYDGSATEIIEILRKIAGRLRIQNADERRQVHIRKALFLNGEFKALWDRIKYRTTYRVLFDNNLLISACASAINQAPPVTRTRLEWRKSGIAIGRAGVEATEIPGASSVTLANEDIELPDLITELQDRTLLTRKSIVSILISSGRVEDFRLNPQHFIEDCAAHINRQKQLTLVDGIKYAKYGDGRFYAQELFESIELTGYLKNMLTDTPKSVFDGVIFDSLVERDFAQSMELNESVTLYAKLPGWFTVPTPLGNYNPDWAVVVNHEGQDSLYFVVETKGTLVPSELRDTEQAKVECAKAHFEALGADNSAARYILATDINDLVLAGLS